MKGDLNVSGNARITGLTNCDTLDTDASGNLVCGTDASGGGTGVVDPTVDCTTECFDSTHTKLIYVKGSSGSGCAGIGLDCSEECYDSTHIYSECTAGSGCSGSGTDCTLQCYNTTYTDSECTAGSGCSGSGTNCALQCYDTTHTYSGCTAGSGCSGPGTDCSRQCYDSTHEKKCTAGSGCSGSVACPSGQVCSEGIGCRHDCICDGTGYETHSVGGDTVYVDCNADKCWTPTQGTYYWDSAVSHCSGLTYGGFTDWVLPDITTLQNLCNSNSCFDTCFGGEGYSDRYWSSSERSSNDAYELGFDNCNVLYTPKAQSRYVRCLRG